MAKIALQGNDTGTGTLTLQAPVTNLNRNLVLPDVDGTLSTMEQVKLPIGSFMWFTGTVAPEAFIVADGELRSRAAFPDLWAFAQASGNISVDDASWTFGQYSPGNGSTTFRVPKVDDRFIRGKSGTRAVGLVEEDAFQGHTFAGDGDTPFRDVGYLVNGLGNTRFPALLDTNSGNDLHIVSDGTNGAPRTADETRPKALTMLPCIKAYDVISDPNVLNAVGVVNEISRLESEKLRKDENINLGVSVAASGTAVDFVGIPEGVKRITVMFDGVSTNGLGNIIVQLGDGVIQTTGYSSVRAGITNGPTTFIAGVSNGFIFGGGGAALTCRGSIIISKMNNSTWVYSGTARSFESVGEFYGGDVVFSGTLDRIRITTGNGTDQFDSGTINISWEF